MADTGAKYPTSYTSNNWADITNLGANDNNDAYGWDVDLAYDFSFSVPSGATIDGIKIEVEAEDSSTGTLEISLSWNGGSNYTSTKSDTFTSRTTKTYGGSTDTWGRTWSDSEFSNTNFRCKLDATPGDEFLMDFVRITVYYTESSSATDQWINIDDVWRQLSELWVNIDDTWRKINELWINKDDVWRKCF